MEEIDRKIQRRIRRQASKQRGEYDGRYGTKLEPYKRDKYKHSYDLEDDNFEYEDLEEDPGF